MGRPYSVNLTLPPLAGIILVGESPKKAALEEEGQTTEETESSE
jgi:hypothetical protein